MKPFTAAFRLILLVTILTLLTALTGCFVGQWFGDDLPPVAYIVTAGEGAEVWVIQPEADDPARVSPRGSTARFPRWAPGKRFLAWVSDDAMPRLMVLESETGEVQALVSGIDAAQPPVWSPEGDRIAYVANAGDSPDMYMVELATGQETRLTLSAEHERIGDWSPDGEWIIFTEQGRDGLLLRNPHGVNLIELTDGVDSNPVWSPKGDRIAFLRDTDEGRDLYVLRPTKSDNWADDTDEVAVADTDKDEFSPVWSSDGRRLAFVVQLDGQTEIFTVLVDGSERKQLTYNRYDDLMPAWSQTGEKIIFVSYAYGNAEILYMSGDGSEQKRLTANDYTDTQPDW